ncbi:MAG: MerR family transcriptional regulator, partial [Actinomycetes bacterium]
MTQPTDLLTIDQLALQSGMTVRTLRSHASRGLLQPPIIRGRTGYYGPAHLARLGFIRDMQDAGFSLASIEQILAGVPADAGEAALSVIRGLLAPWRSEPPVVYEIEELLGLFGPQAGPEHLDALIEMGGAELTPDGQVRVVSPGLLAAGAEGAQAGLPLEGILEAGRLVATSAQE